MSTPRYVKRMFYSLKIREGVEYISPAPVSFVNEAGTFDLVDRKLTVSPKGQIEALADAKAQVEPTLEAWHALSDLEYAPGEFRFEYERSDFEFKSPPPPGVLAGTIEINIKTHAATLSATGVVRKPRRTSFPQPPLGFILSPDAETMKSRYLRSIQGAEPLPGMGYFCLTVVEELAAPTPPREEHLSNKRKAAAAMFGVEPDVLQTLGRLSSEHGGPGAGRKAGSTTPLTDLEDAWIRAAVRELVRRVGLRAGNAPLPLLTMAQLPPLQAPTPAPAP